jgi:hypothetical protein
MANYPDNDTARYNRALCWMLHSANIHTVSELNPPIADAKMLLAKNPQDREALSILVRLLSRAAAIDKKNVEIAGEYLLMAEQGGEQRKDTISWWRNFTDVIPPPPAPAVNPKAGPLRIRWRKTPPPREARLADCLRQLKSDQRLSQ